MLLTQIKKHFGIDEIYGVDFETYYDTSYSLRRMANTEYIFDPRFSVHGAAVRASRWPKAKFFNAKQFATFARGVNWARSGFLAHHAHFDGLIASHHFGIRPRAYFDTLSMARPVMPVRVALNLDALSRAFGGAGKSRKQALVDVKGVKTLSPEQFKALAAYGVDDIDDTWMVFRRLLDMLPIDFFDLTNIIVRMYAQPTVMIEQEKLEASLTSMNDRKDELVASLGVTRDQLRSAQQFAALLEAAGAVVPLKVSARTQKPVPALAKNDEAFVKLKDHRLPRVRSLVEARAAVMSSSIEKRTERFIDRSAHGAQPVYYNVWGAKTGRLSGGDKANWQNLGSARKEGGRELRESILPPKDHVFIISDQAQIEARVNAWFSGQESLLDAFRRRVDVYREEAAGIYGIKASAVSDSQRFLGKACVLALGFQAGGPKFAQMLRIGALGPPVDIDDAEATALVRAWRSRNNMIVANWKQTEQLMASAFLSSSTLEHKVVEYVGNSGHGFTMLPGGMAIRYDNISVDESNKMSYLSKVRRNQHGEITYEERTTLYGGIATENNVQALAARIVVGEQMVQIEKLLPHVRTVLTTHDELVHVVHRRRAKTAQRDIISIMETPPAWAKGLPLRLDSHISERYDK